MSAVAGGADGAVRPEAVEAGAELPRWRVVPDPEQLIRYAAASGDFYPLHYDAGFAASLGYDGLPVQGLLKTAWLGRLVSDWLRPGDRLVRLSASYRGMDYAGGELVCGGRVASVADGTAELELWAEGADGRRTTLGRAAVRLG